MRRATAVLIVLSLLAFSCGSETTSFSLPTEPLPVRPKPTEPEPPPPEVLLWSICYMAPDGTVLCYDATEEDAMKFPPCGGIWYPCRRSIG